MSAIEKFNELNGTKIVEAMEKRNFEAYYVKTKEEAIKKVLELIPENTSVAWGGSTTIAELGIVEKLYEKGKNEIIDRDRAKPEEIDEIFKKAMFSDNYLLSSNAVTYDGKLINIDGRSNRLAAMMFGPKSVIIVVGMNKVMPDEESALKRARSVAAPLNSIRLGAKTPCLTTGRCHDCTSEDCICCNIVTTRYSRIENRIKVVLVGEELGY